MDNKEQAQKLIAEIRKWTEEEIWAHDMDGSSLDTYGLKQRFPIDAKYYPGSTNLEVAMVGHALFEVMFREVSPRLDQLEKLLK